MAITLMAWQLVPRPHLRNYRNCGRHALLDGTMPEVAELSHFLTNVPRKGAAVPFEHTFPSLRRSTRPMKPTCDTRDAQTS